MVSMKVIKRSKKRLTVTKETSQASAADPSPQSFNLMYEMDILKQMVHVNVTPLYEIIDDPNSDKIFMVTKYLNLGSLEERLEELAKQPGGMPQEEVLRHFRQLISALHYFHEVKDVAHRGVKPSNMILDNKTGKLCVTDFGLNQFFLSRAESLNPSKVIKTKKH